MRNQKTLTPPKEKQRDKASPRKRSRMSEWYQPSVYDVYAAVCEAKTLLDRIPDAELASAKCQMNTLEDTLWQFTTAR